MFASLRGLNQLQGLLQTKHDTITAHSRLQLRNYLHHDKTYVSRNDLVRFLTLITSFKILFYI